MAEPEGDAEFLKERVLKLEALTRGLTEQLLAAMQDRDAWRRKAWEAAALAEQVLGDCETVAERAERVRAGESEGKPADEVFERLAAKENPPNPCGHSGQALDERCDRCDPPLCSQCHQPLPHHKMDCSLRSSDLKP